jgi:hypothetical protein
MALHQLMDYVSINETVIMYYELRRMWKETIAQDFKVMACFEGLRKPEGINDDNWSWDQYSKPGLPNTCS